MNGLLFARKCSSMLGSLLHTPSLLYNASTVLSSTLLIMIAILNYARVQKPGPPKSPTKPDFDCLGLPFTQKSPSIYTPTQQVPIA